MGYFDYSDGETVFEGYLASKGEGKRPCILLGHAWDGPNEYFRNMADKLSLEGYTVFAFDVYGKGHRGTVTGDNSHLMNPLMEDRPLLRRRLLAAFDFAQKHPQVMAEKMAVVGYCFGGLCALDLARANPKGLRGTVSIHGLLKGSDQLQISKVSSSVLVLNGYEDPMVPESDLGAFAEEMTKAGADWQIHHYGHAKHAFTMVGADISELGIKYNEKAAAQSYKSLLRFLEETLNFHRGSKHEI